MTNGPIGKKYWPSHVFASKKITGGEVRCAEICILLDAEKSCNFYYFVELMPASENICQLGDFGQDAFEDSHYPDIKVDTVYMMRSSISKFKINVQLDSCIDLL